MYTFGNFSKKDIDKKRGKKIKRIRDKSFKYKMSWLFGHKYRILKK